MAEIATGDLEQLYGKSIVLYKGKPVKVLTFNLREATVLSLITGRKMHVEFKAEDFKPPVGRIGFINHGGHAFYVMRNPVRRFSIGHTQYNTVVRVLDGHRDNQYAAYEQVRALNVKGWGAALMNDYPPFKNAIGIAKETEGSCAFDKQFAVDAERNIYYKHRCVGTIPPRTTKLGRIQFQPEFQYLELLVEPHYEKTIRTFEPA